MKTIAKQRNLFQVNTPDYQSDNSILMSEDQGIRDNILTIWNNSNGWILGHAMNGIIWGKVHEKLIVLAHDANPKWGAPIKTNTLMDLRIFNLEQELRIWRKNSKLHNCLVKESGNKGKCRAFNEKQIFIAGDRIGQSREISKVKFSLIEGPSGQRQAIPVDWDGKNQTYCLHVRHYVQPRQENNMLRVTDSRLLKIDKA